MNIDLNFVILKDIKEQAIFYSKNKTCQLQKKKRTLIIFYP